MPGPGGVPGPGGAWSQGGLLRGVPGPGGSAPGGYLVETLQHGHCCDGTHPTGMHSCYSSVMVVVVHS